MNAKKITEIELEATFNRGYKEGARDYASKCNPVKELSGVEIIGMSGKYDFTYEVDIIDFARAILRKAQEK